MFYGHKCMFLYHLPSPPTITTGYPLIYIYIYIIDYQAAVRTNPPGCSLASSEITNRVRRRLGGTPLSVNKLLYCLVN